MVNHRLVWYLKTNNLTTNAQCGYQKKRGHIDHLTNLERYINEAFIRGEHVTTVFFDLEKAYNTTWKFGIIKDLHDFELKCRLPNSLKISYQIEPSKYAEDPSYWI